MTCWLISLIWPSANKCLYPSVEKKGRVWWRKRSCSGTVGTFHALVASAASLKWSFSCPDLSDDDDDGGGLLIYLTECFWERTSDFILRMNRKKKREWKGAQATLSFAELESVWVPMEFLGVQQCLNSSPRWIKGCDVCLLCIICSFSPRGGNGLCTQVFWFGRGSVIWTQWVLVRTSWSVLWLWSRWCCCLW